MEAIRVTVEGGVVQAVDNIPTDCCVEVWDFDTEGADPELLEKNEQGEDFVRGVWEGSEVTSLRAQRDELRAALGACHAWLVGYALTSQNQSAKRMADRARAALEKVRHD